MKKILVYVGTALAIAFSLNSCQKEVQGPNENEVVKKGIPFEIVANPVETRTANNGMNTAWVADDAISVMHAVANTTTYVNDGEFTITDPTTNTFNGEVASALEEGASYDWYMVYPYNSHLESIANVGDDPARYYIGKRSDQSQEQDGNNSKAHLAGTNFPLFGVQKNVAYNEKPALSVNHIASYIEVKVTNTSETPLVVQSVSFTAPEGEKIVGQYTIDFSQNPMTITMYSSYASETAKLKVTNGDAIAPNETASFFMGIKPFVAAAGKVLKVSVNGYEKEINLTNQTIFSAGKIKKINFNYDQDESPNVEATFIFNTSAGLSELGITEPTTNSTGTSLDGKTCVKEGISLSFALGTNSNNNAPIAWKTSSGLQLRTYVGNTLTFSAPFGYKVTEIKFSSNNNYSASVGEWNAPKWTGEAEVVTLTRAGSGTHQINTINVVCTKAEPKVLDRIELSGNYKTEFFTNDVFDYTGLVVTAFFEDGASLVVDSPSVSSPDMTTAAENVPVTVSYTYGGVTKTAEYYITIVPRPVYIVTLGDTNEQLEADAGASVTLPSRSVSGYTFEGWCETNITTATTTEPTLIPIGDYTPTASITLYPVYSSGEEVTAWVKTELGAVTAGNYVLVTDDGYVFNGNMSSGHGQATTQTMSFTNGVATSIPEGACVLTFTASGNGFTMYNSSNGYLYASKAASGGLAWHQTESDYWSYDLENWVYSKDYSGSKARLRIYNNTFRTYSSNNGNILMLAKESVVSNKSYISTPQ